MGVEYTVYTRERGTCELARFIPNDAYPEQTADQHFSAAPSFLSLLLCLLASLTNYLSGNKPNEKAKEQTMRKKRISRYGYRYDVYYRRLRLRVYVFKELSDNI